MGVLDIVDHFPPLEVAARLAVALGIGLVVGIEREWSNKDLGARTFALTALLGAATTLVGPPMAPVAFVGVFLMVSFANARSLIADHSLETTTSAALMLIFALGTLAGQGHLFTPVATAIVATMLLAWKMELHRFAGGLRPEEIRSGVLLGLLGLVVYPLLPNRFIDPWQLFNPREAWVIVIVLAGLGFVNYVLLKVYGGRGAYLSGVLGGLVNSTAAAVELSRTLGTSALASGVAIATLLLTLLAMAVRNLLILAIFAPAAAVTAAGPLVAMAVVSIVFAWHARRGSSAATEIHLASPVSIGRVLSFATLFLLIQGISTLGQRTFGALGFLFVSALGGVVSSASTSAAAATLASRGLLTPPLAGAGVVLASVTSALVNVPIAWRESRDAALVRRLGTFTLLQCAAGLLVLALQRLL